MAPTPTVAGAAAVCGGGVTRQCYTTRAVETLARVRHLGHVSLFVRDLAATRRFYRDILGLTETGTAKDGRIVFFSAGVRHHDLSCEVARAPGPGPQPTGAPGLYHIAFVVGETPEDLARARRRVVSHALAPFDDGDGYFCVCDPDGNQIELYIEPAPRV